jgi:hypothetical protein
VRRDRDYCRGEAMAMTMMLQACTVARPSAASLKSSFKGLSLKSSTAPMSLAATPRLVVQPAAAAGYKLKTHKVGCSPFSLCRIRCTALAMSWDCPISGAQIATVVQGTLTLLLCKSCHSGNCIRFRTARHA